METATLRSAIGSKFARRAGFRRREAQENTSDPAAQRLEATFELADRILENAGDLATLRKAVTTLVDQLDAANAR